VNADGLHEKRCRANIRSTTWIVVMALPAVLDDEELPRYFWMKGSASIKSSPGKRCFKGHAVSLLPVHLDVSHR